MTLGDGEGNGLRVESTGARLLSVNPLPWNARQMLEAEYAWQLPAPSSIHLNVDFAQMGVGGDNSWGAVPHEPYRLESGQYRYSYRVRPLR